MLMVCLFFLEKSPFRDSEKLINKNIFRICSKQEMEKWPRIGNMRLVIN